MLLTNISQAYIPKIRPVAPSSLINWFLDHKSSTNEIFEFRPAALSISIVSSIYSPSFIRIGVMGIFSMVSRPTPFRTGLCASVEVACGSLSVNLCSPWVLGRALQRSASCFLSFPQQFGQRYPISRLSLLQAFIPDSHEDHRGILYSLWRGSCSFVNSLKSFLFAVTRDSQHDCNNCIPSS